MSSISKNIIIFGSHGAIGQHLVRLISDPSSFYKASVVIRNDEQKEQISSISSNSSNIIPKQFTIDGSTVQEISDVIKGHDAVVFTVGSRGKNLLQVDLDGAVKTFEATVLANVRRFIIISAIHADKREFFSKSKILDYYIAKHYADRILVDEFSEKLDFTVLRPTLLTDGEGTSKIKFIKDINSPLGTVDRVDVAKVIYEIINNKETFGKSYDFANGDLEISDPETFKQ